jgi:adenine/guanine phosphoribosyltransferase-like PRPP-binding protein
MREFDQRFRLVGWQGLIGTAVSGLLFSIPVGGLFATDCLVSRKTKTPAL